MQNPNALIIDDENDICYLLGNLLRQKNLSTESVNSLQEAEDVLQTQNPEIVFLDNYLPDGRGINFIEHIKKSHPSTRIVMITAHDTAVDRDKAFKNGADYFISKPFSREIIFKTLESLNE